MSDSGFLLIIDPTELAHTLEVTWEDIKNFSRVADLYVWNDKTHQLRQGR